MPSVNQISETNGSINLLDPDKNVLFHCVVRSYLEVINPVALGFLSSNR